MKDDEHPLTDEMRTDGSDGRPKEPPPPFEPDYSIITDLVKGQTLSDEEPPAPSEALEEALPPPFEPDYSIITDRVKGPSTRPGEPER